MPFQLDNEPELRKAQEDLFHSSSQAGWILVDFVGPAVIHFSKQGKGDLEELKPHLLDDKIQYPIIVQ